MATATNWSLSLVFAQCSPIALTRIGSDYFYCFVAFNWVAVFVVWLWYPETVGRSLEEVEEVFGGRSGDDEPEITLGVEASPKTEWKPPRSHLRHKGVHPLSMHPITCGSWSSKGGSSPRLWSKQMENV